MRADAVPTPACPDRLRRPAFRIDSGDRLFRIGCGDRLFRIGCESLIPPILDSHFDGYFHRGRPVVGIKDPGKVPGQEGQKSFRQLHGRFVGKPGKDDMLQLACLSIDLFGDIGVTMSMDIDPPAADRIDISPALCHQITEYLCLLRPEWEEGGLYVGYRDAR